jgi:hypothetical protein
MNSQDFTINQSKKTTLTGFNNSVDGNNEAKRTNRFYQEDKDSNDLESDNFFKDMMFKKINKEK